MKKYILETFKILIIAAIVIVSVSATYAWTGPQGLPPANNVGIPLNALDDFQSKAGILGSHGFYSLGTGWFSTSTRKTWPPPSLILGVNGSVGAKLYCDDDGANCHTSSEIIPIPAGGAIPSGLVVAFNLSACPAGWSPLAEVKGRSIVGLNSGGTLILRVGDDLSDKESRSVSQLPPAQYIEGYTLGGEMVVTAKKGTRIYSMTNKQTTDFNVKSYGSTGIPAPYIQLLYCEKN